MRITSKEFEKYVKVQKTGKTNMTNTKKVCKKTGLTKEQVKEITQHHKEYTDLQELIQ